MTTATRTPSAATAASAPSAPPESPLRWAAAVGLSVAVPAVLVLAGMPRTVGALAGFSIALLAIGDRVAGIIRARGEAVHGALGDGLGRMRTLLADERFAQATHGHMTGAAEVLAAGTGTPLDPRAAREVAAARERIDAYESALRETRHQRAVPRRSGFAPAVGGLVADTEDEDEERLAMKHYGDPANLPDWIRHPVLRDVLPRIGDVLDDVRRLHNAEIEWAVLLFTMWSRMLLVGFAPLLGSVSSGHVPLNAGVSWRDVPWLLAVPLAAGTALAAPRLASAVMRDDDTGRKIRRTLLRIEVPVAVAMLAAAPCWPVAVFAAGWTNWWQRPTFDWIRFAIWAGAVVGLLAAGMTAAGVGTPLVLLEVAVAMVVIAVTGGSYGAMLPVSASVVVRSIVGGLLAPVRARHRADRRLDDVVEQLQRAAHALAQGTPPRDFEAAQLRRHAAELAAGDRAGRSARRIPRGLKPLFDQALERGGPLRSSDGGRYLIREARLADRPEPLTVQPLIVEDARLADLQLPDRRTARALTRFVVEVVLEARRYGTGPLETVCRFDGHRIVVRFLNVRRSGPVRHGRGTGEQRLADLARRAGGSLGRGEIDGSAIDLLLPEACYAVTITFPRERFVPVPLRRD